MKLPEVKKSRLCWIRSFMGVVHVTTGYEMFYLSNKGRIISSCPVGVMHGLKPGRLEQFNQYGRSKRYSLVCREGDLDKSLGRFLRKYNKVHGLMYAAMRPQDRPAIHLVFDRATNDHPLHDVRRKKVARIKARSKARSEAGR